MRILIAVLLLVTWATGASAERSVALVIGNGAYETVSPLDNPATDAAAMAAALERLGFAVIHATDLSQDGMRKAVGTFSQALEGADTALFYYAGHGMQLSGRNFLIPTDAVLNSETDVALSTIPLDVILAQMDRAAKTRIVFLDACRNNPFEARLTRQLGSTRSASVLGNGLAPIETEGGTFVGFATDPGAVAYDGDGAHSPFTAALLKHIEAPGLEINAMMTRVRADVYAQTQRLQRPWSSSSLLKEVFLAPEAPVSDNVADAQAFEAAQAANTPDSYRAYLDAYPQGLFRTLSETRLAALEQEEKAEEPLPEQTTSRAPEPKVSAPEEPEAPNCPSCPETVLVPGGATIMGDAEGTPAERPEVAQTIPAFHMAKTEITVGDIRRYEAATGRRIPRSCFVWTAEGRLRKRDGAYWGAPGFEISDASPAACISWEDAQNYLEWLNSEDAQGGWRLPTEAEFEYAARAGQTGDYAWLGGLQYICANVNGADASSRFRWRNPACTDGAAVTAPAEGFPPNGFGLTHMIGNLWEWTADCWNASHKGAFADGRARTRGTCASRVLRGGSWDDPVENLRSAYRVGIPRTRRQANVGFRLVRDVQ